MSEIPSKLSNDRTMDAGDHQDRAKAILSEDDVAKLMELSKSSKADATLGPLSAHTRSAG